MPTKEIGSPWGDVPKEQTSGSTKMWLALADTYTDRLFLGHMSDVKNNAQHKNTDPTVVRTRDRTICNRMLYH